MGHNFRSTRITGMRLSWPSWIPGSSGLSRSERKHWLQTDTHSCQLLGGSCSGGGDLGGVVTGKRSPQELARAHRYRSLWNRNVTYMQAAGSCHVPLMLVMPPLPAMPAGCDDGVLHLPVWTAQVTVDMAGPSEDGLSDSWPAISVFWKASGKNHHRELFLFWFLILRQEYRNCLRKKIMGQAF